MGTREALSKVSLAIIISIVLISVIIGVAILLTQRGGYPVQTATSPGTYAQPPAMTATITAIQSPVPTATITIPTPIQTATQVTQVTQPQGNVVLRVLSRHPTDILEKARIAFLQSDLAKRYGVVDVRTIVIDASAWPDFVRRGNADVLWGGGPTLFDTLYINGLLAPLDSEPALSAMRDIPDSVGGNPMKRVGPDGKIYWVAAAISSFGITINKDVIKQFNLPTPATWEDLGKPEFGVTLYTAKRPSVAIAQLSRSTSTTRMAEIILQAYGWDKGWRVLAYISANADIKSGSEDARNAVINGEVAAALTIDFYGYTAMIQNPATQYIIPQGATVINGDPIAMANGTRNREAALAFIAWVLSPEGQKIWLDRNINRMPANPKVFETPEGAQRPDLRSVYQQTLGLKGINFSDEEALSYELAIQVYYDGAFVDPPSYKQAWTLLVAKLLRDKTLTRDQFEDLAAKYIGNPLELIDPVTGMKIAFTKEAAQKINSVLVKDQSLIDKYRAAIARAAEDRYQALIKILSG
ncbi:MAG: ABC transporter substrate-binding protein [Desulfurococcales archaeon]|jgi:ABC-type Fe3+ transport system substrate-binding protein|nr:ABC transporter substrate-binding protein [Desulfurococcales archaeon]